MIVQSVVPDYGMYAALVVGNRKFNKYEDAFGLHSFPTLGFGFYMLF